jgi:phage-Barnase-EndoU-ColicinE5/D-RelE like nuclease3
LSKISDLVLFAKQDPDSTYKEINFGIIPNFQSQSINAETGVDTKGSLRILSTFGIRHAFSTHGDNSQEQPRGQTGITDKDFELVPEILKSPDGIEKGNLSKKGDLAVLFKKEINGKFYHVVMNVKKSKEGKSLVFGTMYIKNAKGR